MKLTEQEIDDIMVTAFEGGVNYWVGNINFAGIYIAPSARPLTEDGHARCIYEMLSQGFGLNVLGLDYDEDIEVWHLTLDKFNKGVQIWLNEGGDIENYDADDADRIIQYALFDELVYG